MPDKHEDELQHQLLVLRQEYEAELPGRLADLDTALEELRTRAGGSAALARLHGGVHKLAGSSATFGHPLLGERARDAEIRLKAWLEDAHLPDEAELETLARVLMGLREALSTPKV